MAKLKPVPAPAGAPAGVAAPAAGGGKSKMILLAAIGVVVVGAAAAGGTWFGLRQQHHAEAAAEQKPAEKKAPVFVTLEPFTVNLLQESGDHYLQAGIVYQVDNEKTVDAMKTYMPMIRNRILLLLSGKKPAELAQTDGKQKLVNELVVVARESLPEGGGADRGVTNAFLSAFVIQ
jgi:flagellar FliL protein